MADVRCPMCGKPNPEELEECQFCRARLKPVIASPSVDSQTIMPGGEPVKRNTSELEKINLSRGAPTRPDEAPTEKNRAELDQGLPSWLRTLREGKPPAAGESMAKPSAQESLPSASQPATAPDSSKGLPDRLFGLIKAASDDEEVPDWLASLRDGKTVESAPAPAAEEELSPGLSNAEWMARLGSEPQKPPSEPPAAAKIPATEQPESETSPEPAGEGDSLDRLKTLQSPPSGAPESLPAVQGGDNLPEGLSGLPGISAQSSPSPDRMGEPAQAESMLDWLDKLKQKSIPPESATSATPAGAVESVPDRPSSFGSAADTPASHPAENVPEWLSNLEEQSAPGSETPEAIFSSEPQSANLPGETPSWLSQLQANVNAAQETQQHKDDVELIPAAPTSPKETGPLPEWLSGIKSNTPISNSTPALIEDNKDNPPGEQGEKAFSMETPDWLSKLNPDQVKEKKAIIEDQADSGNLEAAELPSWVQAMRPVESVVESKTAALVENQVPEQNGPLAGLSGVLPSGPGLGLLRKPSAYSMKLRVSDGQHRYAATLDRLIAGETNPRTLKRTRLHSNQLLRWLITVLLFLAVGLPIIFDANKNGVQIAPATSLESSDQGASSRIIDGLSGNIPVLVVFDYDPALSGELEAVAAPIMDRLLSKGNPLALISTSPTGPILAEHFLQTTPLVKDYHYQSGRQYVNLGYLAGGPAGILYFADAPAEAVTFGVDGQPANWGTGPLQNIQKLSDFAAVIILTDNADTGRLWIEQAGPLLGNAPMLMGISAQAEPMIRPYFDSGQLKGLISGLSDAKIYEQSNQSLDPTHQFGLDNQYWDSFSVGMLVAELLIVAGVVMGVVIDLRARHKDSGEEA